MDGVGRKIRRKHSSHPNVDVLTTLARAETQAQKQRETQSSLISRNGTQIISDGLDVVTMMMAMMMKQKISNYNQCSLLTAHTCCSCISTTLRF